MDIELIKKELNAYFEYIKTIYLNEFSKYITNKTKEEIKNLTDIFEFNPDLTFKVICTDKITFNLDLKSFVEENELRDESSLIDISPNGKKYVQYLLENEDNIYEVIKNKILKQILFLFTKGNTDVVSMGTVDILLERLVKKYNLPSESYISSKEKDVALYMKQIVGEDVLLAGVINHDLGLIKANYDLYVEDSSLDNYDQITKSFNKVYQNYHKKIGKVYFTDSLYEYENLDYDIKEKTSQIKSEKKNINMSRIKRLSSVKNALLEINKHKFLFNSLERLELENLIIEVDKIIEKIMKSGKEKVLDYISEEYAKLLQIENDAMKFASKVWNNTLTSISNYHPGGDFNFLLGTNKTKEIVEATYVTSEHLRKIKTLKCNYGFIYELSDQGIIYSSTNNFIFKEFEQPNYKENYSTIFVGDKAVEIDNQDVSKLVTPAMILKNNLNHRVIENKIILDSSKIRRVGIYCFVEGDLENSSNYNKALELADTNDLPIIKIYKDAYYVGKTEEKPKLRVKIVEQKEPKLSMFDKIKQASAKVLYEETTINEFKKTL